MAVDIKITDHQLVDPKTLKPHPKNPNEHSENQIQALAKIIKYQGWRLPIIVSKRSGYITAGHGRLEAALALGETQVPVVYQDYANDDEEYAHIVSDNAIAARADLNLAKINVEIPSLGPDFDIELLGIDNFTLDPKFEEPDLKSDPKMRETELNKCPNCGVMIERG